MLDYAASYLEKISHNLASPPDKQFFMRTFEVKQTHYRPGETLRVPGG
jgi:hypothetical protein